MPQLRLNRSIFVKILALGMLLPISMVLARATINVVETPTVGQLARDLVPLVFPLGLMLLSLATPAWPHIEPFGRLWWRQFIALVPLSFAVAVLAMWIGSYQSTYALMLWIAVTLGMIALISNVLSKSEMPFIAFIGLTLSVLLSLEWDFRYTAWGGVPLGPVVLTPSIVAIGLLGISTLVRTRSQRLEFVRHKWPLRFLACFIISMFIACLISIEPLTSFREFWLQAICFPLVFLIVLKYSKMAITAGLVTFCSVRTLFSAYFLVRAGKEISSTLYGEGVLAATAHTGLLAVLAMTMASLMVGFVITSSNWPERVVSGTAAAIATLVLLWTGQRAQLVGLMVAVVVALALSRRVSVPAYGLLIGLGLFVLLNPLGLVSAVLQRFQGWNSVSDVLYLESMRFDLWKSALEMMHDHPFGIGLRMFDHYWPFYRDHLYLMGEMPHRAPHAHQIFLHYGAEGGVGSMVALLLFVVAVLRACLLDVSRLVRQHGFSRPAIVLFSGFVAFIVQGSIGSSVASLTFAPLEGLLPVSTILDLGIIFWALAGSMLA